MFIALAFFFLKVNTINCQDSLNTSYASAVLYILHEQEIIDKVRKIFPKAVKRKQKCLKLAVSKRVEYCPVYDFFSDYIDASLLDSITGKKDTVTPNEFDKANRFESFEVPYLTKLGTKIDAELMIRFSKLNNHYILAEILDKRLNFGKFRYGKSIQILLFYGDQYIVQEHYLTARIYN